MVKVRIPLNDDNCKITKIYDKDDTGDSQNPSPELPGLPDASVRFKLKTAPLSLLPEYNFSRYAHPATNINLTVPDKDMEIVRAWLGNMSAASGSPSDTFVNRMTASVTDAIERYYDLCSRLNLFTRPFKIGFGLKLSDGDIFMTESPLLLTPSTRPPFMVIREPSLSVNALNTVTEIINTPMQLSVSIMPFDINSINETVNRERGTKAVSLVIFATRQAAVISGDEKVSDIRTAEIFGERVPIWNYNRLTEDMVIQHAQTDSSFRIIADIPLEEAATGMESLDLPPAKNLGDWSSFPSYPDNPNTDTPPSRLEIETTALDLNRPEEYKRVRGVTLRGVFNREISDNGVRFTLYGSHHRQDWKILAKAAGAHIRFLRGVRYRWFKVHITAPPHTKLDALTFEIR